MKKRMIALLLVFVLVMLPGCSKSENPSGGNENVTQAPANDNSGKKDSSDTTGTVTEAPASGEEELGNDWRTQRSYSDDYVINEDLSVCFAPLDDGTGFAAYNSADGSRVGTLVTGEDVGAEGFVTDDINGDGSNDIVIIAGSYSYFFVYTDKPWIEGQGGGCFEFYTSGGDGPEDNYEGDEYSVDALGNTPDVYTFNYGVAESKIRNVTDYGDYLVVTFDAMYQISLDIEDLADVRVGDVIYVREKPVTVIDIVTLPDYSEQVSHESVEEAGLDGRVVVLPENLTDFYTEETIERAGFNENPEAAAFGFVFFDDAYYAYSDWEWDDCYCDMTYCALAGAKFVVTDNTTVHPCYYIYETYGENYTMPGTEYFHLRENEEEQEQRGIQIDDATSYRIYLKYENDGYTGEIEELNEIYMP